MLKSPGTLTYFKERGDRKPRKPAVSLRQATVRHSEKDCTVKRPHVFKLTTRTGDEYVFSAGTAMQEQVRAAH